MRLHRKKRTATEHILRSPRGTLRKYFAPVVPKVFFSSSNFVKAHSYAVCSSKVGRLGLAFLPIVPPVERQRFKWNEARLSSFTALAMVLSFAFGLLFQPQDALATPKIWVLTERSNVADRIYIEGWVEDRRIQQGERAPPYLKWEAKKITSELELAKELLQKGENAYRQIEASDAQMGLQLGAELLSNHLDQGAELKDAASAHALLGALYSQEGFFEEAALAFGDALSLMPTLPPLDLFGDEERTLFMETAENLAFTDLGTVEVKQGPYEVWVDGRFIGVSPLKQSFTPGLHVVTLRRSHKMRQTQTIRLSALKNWEVTVEKPRRLKIRSARGMSAIQLHPDDEELQKILAKNNIGDGDEVWVFRVYRFEEEVLLQAVRWGPQLPFAAAKTSVLTDAPLSEGLRELLVQWAKPPLVPPVLSTPKALEPPNEEPMPTMLLGGIIGGSVAVVSAVGIGLLVYVWSASKSGEGSPDNGEAARRRVVLGF